MEQILHLRNTKTTVFILTACGVYCNQCSTNGASKCDASQCQAGTVYVESSQTCECK